MSFLTPPVVRAIEAIFIFTLYPITTILFFMDALRVLPGEHFIYLALLLIPAFLLADWISGFVHWFFDTFGDENTIFFGPHVISAFREHHVLPRKICEHGYIEANGNTFILGTLFGGLFLFLVNRFPESPLLTWPLAFLQMVSVISVQTNHVHKWAHLDPAQLSAPVRLLQKTGLILSPTHHRLHHQGKFDSNFCILSGVMDPLLERIAFWPRLKRLFLFVGKLFGSSGSKIKQSG